MDLSLTCFEDNSLKKQELIPEFHKYSIPAPLVQAGFHFNITRTELRSVSIRALISCLITYLVVSYYEITEKVIRLFFILFTLTLFKELGGLKHGVINWR